MATFPSALIGGGLARINTLIDAAASDGSLYRITLQ